MTMLCGALSLTPEISMEVRKSSWKKVLLFAAIIGPGLITATADNDSGGIATYAFAGAQFGYSLLWTTIPVLLLLIYTLDISTRLGTVTGIGLAGLFRERFRVKLTIPLLLLVLIANLGTTMSEFAGIASSFHLFGSELHLYEVGSVWGYLFRSIIVIISAIGIWFFVVKGNYRSVEKVFLTLVFFYAAYIISAVLAKPDWNLALGSLVKPNIKFEMPFLFTMIGVIGTTVTPWMYFYHNSTVVEKGITVEGLKYSRLDSFIGSIAASVVAFFITVAAAATIFVNRLPVHSVEDIAKSLAPIAGSYAEFLFAFGLFNASIFAAAILPLSTAYTICEALGWEVGINKRFKEAPYFYTIFTGMIVLGVAAVLIPGAPLLFMMRLSQVANGVLLPFFLIYLLLLAENEKIMGKFRVKGIWRWFGWVAAGALIVLNVIFSIVPFIVKV